ncbi:MAG: 50S ribosomal protein L22 [Candidatus Omnitrophota bacterium]|nr:50S ribosomal protein L22 [Candidatus Omnitrophota bacterium]
MVSKAILRYTRLSPRKFRLIIPLVKGKRAEEAIAILGAVKKKASGYGIDLLKSAIANAKVKNQGIDTSTLYISKMVADPGPMLKRFRAASMGRASMIHKHTSHLTVELDVIKTEVPVSVEGKAKDAIKKSKDTDKNTRAQEHKSTSITKKPKAKIAAKK